MSVEHQSFTGHSDIFIITKTEVIRGDLEKGSSYSFDRICKISS